MGLLHDPFARRLDRMLLQTILNRLHKHKSFVYGSARWITHEESQTIEVPVRPRANGRPICSGCGKKRPGYDRLAERRYQFVPLWGLAVFLLYAPRRVDCPDCGVKVERVPWARGKSRLTTTYQWFLAAWAKRLSWQEVADSVPHQLEQRLPLGPVGGALGDRQPRAGRDQGHRRRRDPMAKGAPLPDAGLPDRGRLQAAAVRRAERTEASLRGFFEMLGEQRSQALQFVCSDMWKPYLKVIAEKAGQAVHVLDRFHIMAKMNKAIDEVRAAEAKRLKHDGYEPVLKHSRWCLLKRPENLTDPDGQAGGDAEVQPADGAGVPAAGRLPAFLGVPSPCLGGSVSDGVVQPGDAFADRADEEGGPDAARHHDLILNWFRAKGTISAGVVEGLNYNAKLTMKKAYGFRTARGVKIALYHRLGALPEPEFTHKFW